MTILLSILSAVIGPILKALMQAAATPTPNTGVEAKANAEGMEGWEAEFERMTAGH